MTFKIELNPNLAPVPFQAEDEKSWGRFHDRIVGLLKKQDKDYDYTLIRGFTGDALTLQTHGLLETFSRCYSNHQIPSLHPHDFWYMIMTEVSKLIHEHKDLPVLKSMFTESDEKQEIVIESASMVDIDVNYLVEKILERTPKNFGNILIPQFTYDRQGWKEACHAAFADAMSVYYSYGMLCCGLPAISINGPEQDWQLLHAHVSIARDFFTGTPVFDYLDRAAEVVEEMVLTTFGTDPDKMVDYWKDVFTQKNIGSGGQQVVNGWITKLYAGKVVDPAYITNFSSTLSLVPYKQLQTKREFTKVYGALATLPNKFNEIETVYSSVIFERTVAKPPASQNSPLRVEIQKARIPSNKDDQPKEIIWRVPNLSDMKP